MLNLDKVDKVQCFFPLSCCTPKGRLQFISDIVGSEPLK